MEEREEVRGVDMGVAEVICALRHEFFTDNLMGKHSAFGRDFNFSQHGRVLSYLVQ